MQIQCMPILKVIFVLSTIVAVTDCCSSRILLLRQHTFQIEEHVVQLVNPMELQRQLNANGQPSEPDLFTDPSEMIQVSPDLGLEGELASIATTERDTSTEAWSTDEEQTTKTMKTTTTMRTTTTTSTSTTTTTAAATALMTSTITTATGEPPPDDSTSRLAAEDAIFDNETPPTTATPTTTNSISTSTSTTTPPTTSTSKPKAPEEFNFKLPCSKNYNLDFCMNGGKCYRLEYSDSFSYCVCADDYVGERCDSKTENGVYVPLPPTSPKPQLKTAHIVFSFPMLLLLSTIYVVFGAVFMLRNVSAHRRKQQQLHLHKQRFFVSC